ncbi:MAG: hypothetical protein H7A23_17410 [Leptospiraceae bacterium]|nr:hypothetical protein [Leptospiraceae bacterium]
MWLLKTLSLFLIFSICYSSIVAQEPENAEATITLPFENIYKLEQNREKPEDDTNKPPETLLPNSDSSIENKATSLIEKKEEVEKKQLLPNLQEESPKKDKALERPTQKKSKKFKQTDESQPPFERGIYQLKNNLENEAQKEFNDSILKQGEYSLKAKFDQIRLLARERKRDDALSIINGLDPENKYKGLFELASGLDSVTPQQEEFNQNLTFDKLEENEKKKVWWDKDLVKESKKDAITTYLTIITEAKEYRALVSKAHWALANLLYKISEYQAALDHLAKILLYYKDTEFIDDAIYLSARIYESEGDTRDLGRAQKYYNLFLKNREFNPVFSESVYLPKVKERIQKLVNNNGYQ